MSKIINQTNWKIIYCVGCGEQIGHDVTLDEMENNEFDGFKALMCLNCFDKLGKRKWKVMQSKIDELIGRIANWD